VSDTQTRSAPLYETIYEVLRSHLEAGALTPGLVLGEANVARAFKASRIPAAAALKRLRDEGLIIEFGGRGYVAPTTGPAPKRLRIELGEAGLNLPTELEVEAARRNIGLRIYPEVEHTVATCLAYGRFMLNESALAEHYNVSRTIAHEVLTRLARTGIIVQETNQRWYAGPLTSEAIREHYEMRWILEPVALRQAFPKFTAKDLQARRERVIRAQGGGERAPPELERIEEDLHVDTVARCNNTQLLQAVRRSQLLLIATHSAFRSYQSPDEISRMLEEHRTIYDALLAGDVEGAAATLESHLHRSLRPNIELMGRLGPLPDEMRVSYLTPVDRAG
jgi:DNA-binding GntR family transcriptional regulator